MSFSDLKRKSNTSFEFLQKELEKSSTNSSADDRFWKPELDASGNGYAVIRFLPQPEGESLPWAKLYSHAFQGPGGWFIENSLTTLGQQDPVSVYNNKLWNSGTESDRKLHVNKSVNFLTTATCTLYVIPRILIMKVRFFSTVMVRKSLIKSWRR